MLRSQQLPKRKESCLRQTRPSVRSMRLGREKEIQTPLSIQPQTQLLRCGSRSRYERRLAAGTKKAQTSGARLRIAGTFGHFSRSNSTLNRRTSLKFAPPAIATNRVNSWLTRLPDKSQNYMPAKPTIGSCPNAGHSCPTIDRFSEIQQT